MYRTLSIIVPAVIVILILGTELLRRTPYGRLSLIASLIRRVGSDSEANPKPFDANLRRSGLNNDVRLISRKPRPLYKVSRDSVSGLFGDIPIRIYQPSDEGGKRVCIYYHGGGYVLGNLETADSLARELSYRWDAVVISVEYALAPEKPYPAALEDGYAALLWAVEYAAGYGGNPSELILSGDSAGGNLAAATVLKAHEQKGPEIFAQVLFYPWVDLRDTNTMSMRNFASGYLLTAEEISWFTEQYLPDTAQALEPMASPILVGDCSVFPPTIVFPAEFDVLRDQSLEFAAKLLAAGVRTEVVVLKGQLHGFVSMTRFFPNAIRRTLRCAYKFLDSLNTES